MKYLGSYFVAVFVLAGAWQVAHAQERLAEAGRPYMVEHYPPSVYGQNSMNWDVVQGSRGLVYAANNDGVLVFDGSRWRLIPVETGADAPYVRSLDVSAGDTVYVGARGDFGYLAPDSVGQLRFVSLKGEVPLSHRGFEEVWGTHATPNGVYFQTEYRLYRWNGHDMRIWEGGPKGIHTSFEVRGRIYVRDTEYGLMTIAGDSLRLVPGGKRFADAPVRVMVPYGEERILIGTQQGEFFLYDGTSFEPFPTRADAFMGGARLYHGCALPGGYFALATLGRGVIIIDRQGRVVKVLDQSTELPDGVVNYVYAGGQGMLWMALHNAGIAYVQMPSPLTVYSSKAGLTGIIRSITRHRGSLYVGTGSGLYVLNREPPSATAQQEKQHSSFQPVPGVPLTVWELLSTEHGLLAATDFGIYRVREGQSERLVRNHAYTLLQADHHGGKIFAGTEEGLAVLEQSSSGWRLRDVPGIDGEVRTLYEAPDGALWLGTLQGGVLRVRFPDGLDAPPRVERYDEEDGLPDGYLYVSEIFGEPVVISKQGLFRPVRYAHDSVSGLYFVRDTVLSFSSSDAHALQTFSSKGNTTWLAYEGWIDRIHRQPDGSYVHARPAALHFPKTGVLRLYAEENGILWIGNGDELIRYDPTVRGIYDVHFPPLVRKVTTMGQDREVIFGGTRWPGLDGEPREVAYTSNDLHFSFSMPEYSATTPAEYQYKLVGMEGEWSAWSTATSATYTDLQEGTYRFITRARNERGYVSEVEEYRFQVLPPWYRTWWAYTLYVVALVLGVLGARHYLKESRRAREHAEALARERTVNQRLKQANSELEHFNLLKDTLLANTSHELRTPLTAILGFAEVVKEESESEKHREFLGLIEENGYRLLDTLNALLDIAKIEAGVETIELVPVDLCEKVRKIRRLLQSLADRKGLRLETNLPEGPVYARVQPDYFERVLQNLIDNAIKFTEEGYIATSVQASEDRVEVHVQDTGIGISESFLPHLFKAFQQESAGMARTHMGNGLGLAITARLVDLMHGSIEVQSIKGEGSRFVISLPRYEVPPRRVTQRMVLEGERAV